MSSQKLSPSTLVLLILPTLLWAGNAVVGRLIHDQIPPVTLNFLRWLIAFVVLLPFGASVLRPSSQMWKDWKRYAVLGLLGVGFYNAFQYLALHSSTPINVTLVGSSLPIWTLLIGRLFFGSRMNRWQLLGALVSLLGVLVILLRGDFTQITQVRFVAGDIYMIIATISWSLYGWVLASKKDSPDVARNWTTMLMAQVSLGLMLSAVFAGGEWLLTDWHIQWDSGLLVALLYVALGPGIIALCCWGIALKRVGPAKAGFFNNLVPLFAAALSVLFLGDVPRLYHAASFVLIVGGIMLASHRVTPKANASSTLCCDQSSRR